jgi:isocitrate dehydrogenase
MHLINNTKKSINTTPITVAYGDGIGTEIMEAVLYILSKAEAKIRIETVEIGEASYKKGYISGISEDAWDIIKRNKVFLKAPITTPQGGGYKSLNVTLRKALGLYANIRPCLSYAPFVATKFPNLDVVIVRENEEDLYAGIEYRQTQDCYNNIKLITQTGCEKIIRYAFEYAKKNNRKKVTCFTKDNIMKLTDGTFHRVFDEIGKQYPDIIQEHYILDIGTARLATQPEIFDVVVTLNLYGDVISDIVAEMTGSVGLAGSGNIGIDYAMFEAIHGSAPTMVGQNRANPTALLNAAIDMLVHIGEGTKATLIKNSLLYTIENGIHTPDIARNNAETKKTVGTKEFADAIVLNFGQEPKILCKSVNYGDFEFDGINNKSQQQDAVCNIVKTEEKILVGVDIFIDYAGNGKQIGEIVKYIELGNIKLHSISTKGMKVFPGLDARFFTSDTWRCRFVINGTNAVSHSEIIAILSMFNEKNLDVIKTENLYTFNGKAGYSASQGE